MLTFLWRPPITSVELWVDPWTNLQIVIGPGVVLGFGIAAVLARFSRSSMLEVLGEDYVRTARAKGLAGRTIIWPHALKNAMLPTITVTGTAIGGLLGGAVAVETAFSVPGLGLTLVQALNERDWTIVQNLVLLYGVLFTLVNLRWTSATRGSTHGSGTATDEAERRGTRARDQMSTATMTPATTPQQARRCRRGSSAGWRGSHGGRR